MNKRQNKTILTIGTTDAGGAGEYMLRLSKLLLSSGYHVFFLVQEKTKSENFIISYPIESNSLIRFIKKIKKKIIQFLEPKPTDLDEKYMFYSLNENRKNISIKIIKKIIPRNVDFIVSGWTSGFLNSTDLLTLKLIFQAKIFTLPVDMNQLTGGCHYAWNCTGYINGCHTNCPAILNNSFKKLPYINFKTKYKNAQLGNFTMISGENWTLKQTKDSLIYKNQSSFPIINCLIDTNLFNPQKRDIAKKVFNFDSNKFYILAGAQNFNDVRKGFSQFVSSLNILSKKLSANEREKIVILVATKKNKNKNKLPFAVHQFDFITDYRLFSLLYQACDLFVNSSLQDSGPMMVPEALACGTPVVGFNIGAVHDLVIDNFNGYKAEYLNEEDLASGIQKIFQLSPEEFSIYSQNASNQIEKTESLNTAITFFDSIFLN